jgi:type I restriction enzyme, S subunit
MNRERVYLADIASMRTGKLDSNESVPNGDYPFFTCSQQTLRIDEPAFDTKAVLLGGNNAAGVFPLKYYEGQFNAYQRTYVIESLDPDILNIQFLFYALRPALLHFQSVSIGAATQYLTKGILDTFQLDIPPLPTQNRIADILSAYDDLIENNRRRIQLLEQAARLLYREWFVHLRFPGHEHGEIVDGVPKGWERKPFSQLATFLNGFAFKPTHLGDVGLPIVKIPELRDGPTAKTPRNTGQHIPEKYLLDTGDILFSWSGTLLVNIWNHGRGLLNQHLFKVTPISDTLRGLVYLALVQALDEFQNRTTGSTMKHIRKGELEQVAAHIPSAVLLDDFEATVAPMLNQISVLQRQITKAIQVRDLLLPRLMNGEMSV